MSLIAITDKSHSWRKYELMLEISISHNIEVKTKVHFNAKADIGLNQRQSIFVFWCE